MPVNTRLLDAEQRQQRIHEHDMAHQTELHQTELVVKDENSRRLRVRKHLLEDDNDALQQHLEDSASRMAQLSSQVEQAQSEAKAAKQAYRQLKKNLETQIREASRLKMELQSLNDAAQDSTKVLAEKLALSRELATMKPELEHLRSQLAHQQNVLTEKLALERQLNSAEVELAAEKRARLQAAEQHDQEKSGGDELKHKLKNVEKRLAAEKRDSERLRQELDLAQKGSRSPDETNRAAESGLRERLNQLEASLSAEKSEANRAKKEAEVSLSELQAHNDTLESRVDNLKTRLRSTQNELKLCKVELEALRDPTSIKSQGASRSSGSDNHVIKKRRAIDMVTDDVTVEPVNDGDFKSRRPVKKRGLDHTLLGEKSTFSITPFLNRTKGASVDATVDEDAEDGEADLSHIPHAEANRKVEAMVAKETQNPATQPFPVTSGAEVKKSKPRGRPKKILASTSPNIPPRAAAQSDKIKMAARKVTVLTQVDEESADAEATGVEAPVTADDASDQSADAPVEDVPVKPSVRIPEKKKKRKLVGDSSKTIFDEEDAEPTDLKLKRSNQLKLGQGKVLKNPKLGMARKAFAGAAFSPLKKHRRGVGASFLI